MSVCDLLVVAGEASGDQRAARLLAELRPLVTGLRPFGLGGEELRAAGCETLADSAEIAVVGIVEVLKVLRRARAIFDLLLAETERRGATHALLVDSPELNLRLARELARRGVKVIYYVSPQIWAWRRGRVKAIAQTVERMLVLFPFEVDFYRHSGVQVVHVGHPLVDEVPELPQAWDVDAPVAGPPQGRPYRLALLPGSRASEVGALLPRMLETARRLAERMPIEVRLIEASTVPVELLDRHLSAAAFPVERVRAGRFEAIADSHLALCASGTATLEVGLLGTPLIVLYRLSPFSYFLGRLLVDLPSFSMVNLVLGENAVPELIQRQTLPDHVAAEAANLLADPAAIAAQRARLARLRGALGTPGASRRAAQEVAALLAPGGRAG